MKLLKFKKPSNWKWRPRFYKSKSEVLSITSRTITMHDEGGTLVVEIGKPTPPDSPTPPRAA